MKLLNNVGFQVYTQLIGVVPFEPYPDTLPPDAEQAASSASKRPFAPRDGSLAGVFVGQLPMALPPGYLAWIVNTILCKSCVVEASMARNQCCGRVIVPVMDLPIVLNLSETVLCDSTGIWIARTVEEVAALRGFCDELVRGVYGSGSLSHALPKKCLVLKIQQSVATPTAPNSSTTPPQRPTAFALPPPVSPPIGGGLSLYPPHMVFGAATPPINAHYNTLSIDSSNWQPPPLFPHELLPTLLWQPQPSYHAPPYDPLRIVPPYASYTPLVQPTPPSQQQQPPVVYVLLDGQPMHATPQPPASDAEQQRSS